MDILNEARLILPYMSQARRRIHRCPELGFKEFETTAFVAGELENAGFEVTRLSPTGVLARLRGDGGGRTVLLRADMDALPVKEETGLPYASENAGLSHACGHDMHTAMLLGAARLLAREREALHGEVRLLFQPAEETGSGAREMIAQGVLEGVDACFAQHVAPMLTSGAIATRAGQFMAGAGTFTITVHGAASHGAMPNLGRDALLAGAHTVVALQEIVSREIAPDTPLVLNAGTFHSGNRYNVVADEAVIEGTVRALDNTALSEMGERIERVATSVAGAYRCTAVSQYDKTCNALVTDAGLTALLRAAARELVPSADMLIEATGQMGSEDFSDIATACPSAFAVIGVGGEHPLHSGFFNADESAMPTGAALFARFALDYLAQN